MVGSGAKFAPCCSIGTSKSPSRQNVLIARSRCNFSYRGAPSAYLFRRSSSARSFSARIASASAIDSCGYRKVQPAQRPSSAALCSARKQRPRWRGLEARRRLPACATFAAGTARGKASFLLDVDLFDAKEKISTHIRTPRPFNLFCSLQSCPTMIRRIGMVAQKRCSLARSKWMNA
jgi:hypothetical protein